MIVTIHQPEHFPYMGLFQKVASADLFVVLDCVKFRKNYFQNRNVFKTSSNEDMWFTVPVEKDADKKNIIDVKVGQQSSNGWREKNFRRMTANSFTFKKVWSEIESNMREIYDHERLIDINMASIKWCMSQLEIDKQIVFASELDVQGSKSELLANILRKVGATKYVSGPSGRDYLDMSLFDGIEVEFFQPKVDNHYSTLWNLASARAHGQILRVA